jgi:hypothetical protein
MGANVLTPKDPSASAVERPQFSALFCERFGCAVEDFEKRAFRQCLYPHAKILAPLIRVILPGCFARDLAFIRYLGTTRRISQVVDAASEFHDKGGFEEGFRFTNLKIRVSGSKAIHLAREVYRWQRASARDPATGV